MSKFKDYNSVPLKEGETDNQRTRMERWEKANNRKLKDLSEDEWMQAMRYTLPLTDEELRDLMGYVRSHGSY